MWIKERERECAGMHVWKNEIRREGRRKYEESKGEKQDEMREWEEKNENEGMTTKRENKLLEESLDDDLQIETENH